MFRSLHSFAVAASLLVTSDFFGPALANPLPAQGLSEKRAAEQDTSNLSRRQFSSIPTGVAITSCTQPNTVALTFDDGPGSLTSELLDILDNEGISATFFLIGVNIVNYPDLVQRTYNSGHQVASHTWSHPDLNTLALEGKRQEIVSNEDALAGILGFVPTYFRAPYGSCDGECEGLLSELGYHNIRWDVDTNDWRQDLQTSMDTYDQALTGGNSALVLAHDIHQITVPTLANFMINTARERGYTFATVGECLGDPAGNWYRDPGF